MKNLAIILARRGGAGLKNKHLLPLHGRPLITYTFDHARHAQSLSYTVVTSDSREILSLAQDEGFHTIQRPPQLATADASVQATLLHAMAQVESSGWTPDAIVCLYGNVPIRSPGVIDRALSLLHQSNADSVRTFTPVGKWHPQWMARLDGDKVSPLNPNSIHRRQDLEPLFLHDGAVVAVSRTSMLKGLENPHDPHAFFGVDRRAILTEPGETVEVDRLADLYLADSILRMQSDQSLRHAG